MYRALKMINASRRHAWILILGCMLLATVLRLAAAARLPVDYDEPTYIAEAQRYAAGLRRGDIAVLTTDRAPENPQLMKYAFGLGALSAPERDETPILANIAVARDVLDATRRVSVVFGVLNVVALAWVNPIAGLALAAHSNHVKYTSEVMLEAGPMLFALLCVMSYRRAGQRWNRWLVLSAILLGLAAAGKFMYAVAGVAVLLDMLITGVRHLLYGSSKITDRRNRESPRKAGGFTTSPNLRLTNHIARLLGWGVLSLLAFFLALPYLWPDPFTRLLAIAQFHAGSTAATVNTGRYVWGQPIAWLLSPIAWANQPYFPGLDGVIALLAAIGLPTLLRKHRVHALWLALGLAFLALYSNKMPQYALLVSTPICLSAGLAPRTLLTLASRATGAAQKLRTLILTVPLAALIAFGLTRLNNNPHLIDPEFQRATALIQSRIKPDEIAIALTANPYIEGGYLEPGWRAWNTLSETQLAPVNGMLDSASASALLNTRAAGRHGVWLLTQQRIFGDPADVLRTLLQRQTPINGPSEEIGFERNYALTYFRFESGYASVPEPLPVAGDILPGSGPANELRSNGCVQLRDAFPGGVVELSCVWQSQPYQKLPWDTRASLRLEDSAGNVLLSDSPLILRSGFPYFFFEQSMLGVYVLNVPANVAPGRHTVSYQVIVQDKPYTPRYTTVVTILPP
jgi:hypothetical protein